MERFIDPETGKFKVTVPKLKPKWLEILVHILGQRDPSVNVEKILETINDEWKPFHERGKDRAPRKPKEKKAEPTTQDDPDDSNEKDENYRANTFREFIKKEYPPVGKDDWKNTRHSRPKIRLIQNVNTIDGVFKKSRMSNRSQPYRALFELKKALEELIDTIPETAEVVKKVVIDKVDENEAYYDMNSDIRQDDEDVTNMTPPSPTNFTSPPTPPPRRMDVEENCQQHIPLGGSPIAFGYDA